MGRFGNIYNLVGNRNKREIINVYENVKLMEI